MKIIPTMIFCRWVVASHAYMIPQARVWYIVPHACMRREKNTEVRVSLPNRTGGSVTAANPDNLRILMEELVARVE